ASVLVDRLADVCILLFLGLPGLAHLLVQGFGLPVAAATLPGPLGARAFLARQFDRMMRRIPVTVASDLPEVYRVFLVSLCGLTPVLLARLVLLTLFSILLYCGHLYFIARILELPIGFFALSGVLCAST